MRIPVKYRRHGLHVWCNKCKKTITKSGCKHKASQVYQSRIHNPLTQKQDCIRTHHTKEFTEAWNLHNSYRAELEDRNFQLIEFAEEIFIPTYLTDAAKMYLDYLSGENIPSHEKKERTTDYIKAQQLYLKRFLGVLKNEYNKVSQIPLNQISKKEVGLFHDYLENLKLSDRSYNAHMSGMKYFFRYLVEYLRLEIQNPFEHVIMRRLHYEPVMITEDEFIKLLSVITEENGYEATSYKKKQHYRSWLPHAFSLALLTGERLDSLVNLKWRDVQGKVIGIPNLKVNRIKNTHSYESFTPISQDLREVLEAIGPGNPDDYIIDPSNTGRYSVKNRLTKAFTHFWKLTGSKKEITFKNLRKTYISKIFELEGDRSLVFKHTQSQIAIKHYLDKKETLSKLSEKKMYQKITKNITPLHNTSTPKSKKAVTKNS